MRPLATFGYRCRKQPVFGFADAKLGQLALRGASDFPIDAFRVDRPALTDPSFTASFMV